MKKLKKLKRTLVKPCPAGKGKNEKACEPNPDFWEPELPNLKTSSPEFQNLYPIPDKRYEIQAGGIAAGKTARQKLLAAATASRANFFRNYTYWIGVDGGSETGVACWESKDKRFAWIKTLSFWDFIAFLQNHRTIALKSQTCIVIENVSLNVSINARKRSGNALVMGKIGQNVGSVKRETELLIEYLRRHDWQYVAIRPTSSKLTAEQFKKITGYQDTTNQHQRDAGMLVYGK